MKRQEKKNAGRTKQRGNPYTPYLPDVGKTTEEQNVKGKKQDMQEPDQVQEKTVQDGEEK